MGQNINKNKVLISWEIIKKINFTKKKLRLDIPNYVEAIKEICDKAIVKHQKLRKELKKFQKIIQEVMIFLQEKCNENDYINEQFFHEFILMGEDLALKVRRY